MILSTWRTPTLQPALPWPKGSSEYEVVTVEQLSHLLRLYRAQHTVECSKRNPNGWCGPAPCTCGLEKWL